MLGNTDRIQRPLDDVRATVPIFCLNSITHQDPCRRCPRKTYFGFLSAQSHAYSKTVVVNKHSRVQKPCYTFEVAVEGVGRFEYSTAVARSGSFGNSFNNVQFPKFDFFFFLQREPSWFFPVKRVHTKTWWLVTCNKCILMNILFWTSPTRSFVGNLMRGRFVQTVGPVSILFVDSVVQLLSVVV